MKHVAVMGYGTVGSGVYEVLTKNKEVVSKNVGEELNVKYILDLRDFPGDPNQDKVVHDVNVILDDPDVQIICEKHEIEGKDDVAVKRILKLFDKETGRI